MEKYLAVAGSEKELAAIERFAAEKAAGEGAVLTICHSFSPEHGSARNLAGIAQAESFLTKREVEKAEGKAGFFARNWYSLDRKFGEKTTISGISMGYAHQHEFSYFFRTVFLLLKAISNAAGEHKPNAIVAARGCLAGRCAAACAEAMGRRAVLLDLKGGGGFRMFPNLTREKFWEIRKKLPEIIAGMAAKKQNAGRKTVFIRSRGYLDKLEKKLLEDDSLNVVSLDRFLLGKMLNPLNLMAYLSARKRMGKIFSAAFRDYESSAAFREKMRFEGIYFGEILEPLLRQAAERDWPEFAYLAEIVSRLFRAKKPSALVLWSDFVAFERICALVAKLHGTPSIVVQHGYFWPNPKGWGWLRGFVPLTADRIAVWGEAFKKALVQQGVEPSRVFVTGHPNFDLEHGKKTAPGDFRKKFGIMQGGKMAGFIAQQWSFSQHDIKKILAALAEGKKANGLRFAVKIHQMDYSGIDPELAKLAVVAKDVDFYEFLKASDVVVGESSTGLLEAMILGKPVIVFRSWAPHKVFFPTEGALKAETPKQLESALGVALGSGRARMMLEKRMKKFVYATAFRQDGRAGERLIKLIKSTASI